jgi:glycosyltransferase involved in cell wall biosynthesis
MKILVTFPHRSSFIERDLNILSKKYDVLPLLYDGKIRLLELSKGIMQTDVTLSWFVLGHATSTVLLSKAFSKKSIVIAGGWDVVSMPEIEYGAMRSKDRIRKTKYALKNADRVLAVSESTKKDVLRWIERDVDVVHLGFDPEVYKPKGEKENRIITVSAIRENTLKLKGLETFVKAAQSLPEYKFVLIGAHVDKSIDHLKSISPSNVEFPGYLTEEQLLSQYQSAKVYAQLSYQESFGSALAEAMLCGCVPVVTKRGAMPEVVGDIGYYVEYGDVESTSKAFESALKSGREEEARKRIEKNFSIEKRETKLSDIINYLI